MRSKVHKSTQKKFKEQWRQRFEDFARCHDDDAGIAGWSNSGLKTRVQYFKKSWDRNQTRNLWLDVGCGAGTYSKLLLKEGKNVIALDYSYLTLIKARDKLQNFDKIFWVLGDATNLPLKNEVVDGVLAFGVSQALPNSKDLVNELVRTVTPGGEIWVDGLNKYCVVNMWKKGRRKVRGQADHLRYESPAKLRWMLLAAGAEKAEIIWMPMLPGRWNELQRWVERFQILFKIPIFSHIVCHSFIVRSEKKKIGN